MKKFFIGLSAVLLLGVLSSTNTVEAKKKSNKDQAITLYITRHGKTLLNTLDRVQGWADSPLTDKGEEVAVDLGKGLKKEKVKFDLAFSGDSGRHIQTATLVLKNNGQKSLPFKQMKELREVNYGGFEGQTNEYLGKVVANKLGYKDYAEVMASDLKDKRKKIVDTTAELDSHHFAENYDQLNDRIKKGFDKIIKTAQKKNAKKVLVVSSGDTIMTFLEQIDPSSVPKDGLKNACVNKVVYKNGKYTIKAVNDMSYVEEGEKLDKK